MITIIIGAIVSLLIFFFEQWWKAHHPTRPTPEARAAFIQQMGSWKHAWMGKKRQQYAGILFDKFVQRYDANPPVVELSTRPCTADEAKGYAAQYAKGLTLEPGEV